MTLSRLLAPCISFIDRSSVRYEVQVSAQFRPPASAYEVASGLPTVPVSKSSA